MISKGEILIGNNGHYKILQLLHLSPQLITAEAVNIESDQKVVLKELSLDKLLSWKVLDLFEREVATLRQLDHPQLPRYLNHCQKINGKSLCHKASGLATKC